MTMKMEAIVSRGENQGAKLYPHLGKDGRYVVSKTRFKRDYIRLGSLDQVREYLERGYRLRMSNRRLNTPPSLIRPESIKVLRK